LSPGSHVQAAPVLGIHPHQTPANAWQNYAGRYQHTAHQLGSVQIVYRFHPFFSREVQIIRRLRNQENPVLVVQVEENLRIAIPAWMLDPICCQSMHVQENPYIGIDALLELRKFIDLQSLNTGSQDLSCASMIANEKDENSNNTPTET